jgi:O-antigen/teichoic acid export membrane protein
MLVFQKTSRWEWVFFCGYGFELVFTLLTTSLWKESFRKTQHFKNTIRRLFFLVISTLIGSILIYLDRLIIYPFFGGTELSIYYAASIVGKTVIMFAGPIAGVLLSYLSQMTSIILKDFVSFTFVLSILAVVGYFLCLWISHPLIEILYPELLPYSMEYVPYTIVSAMFEMMYIFIWPIVLRFGKSYYPLVITTVKALFYLVIGIILIRVMGVMGVVVASIIASVTQFLVVLVLGFQVSKKKYQIDSNMCHEMK